MKIIALVCSLFALGIPNLTHAHPAHGDEFQSKGGIDRVPVNPQTDPILGIRVVPIEAAGDGSGLVLIPVGAVVEADGKQIVFVQYENFYEPVPIVTGMTRGDLVEVTSGLVVGEKLVTQGGLSLYAESRKTQNVETSPNPQKPNTTAPTEVNSNPTQEFPIVPTAIGGVAVLGLVGAIALRNKNRTFSDK